MRRPGPARGYVLPLTVVILVIFMLGASMLAQRATVTVRLAQQEREQAEQLEKIENRLQHLLFLLSAVPRAPQGLGAASPFLKLDGTWYKTAEGVDVSVQDTRGLINLRFAPEAQVSKLVQSFGLDVQTAARLSDVLMDYRDPDDLKRLNGAEANEYQLAGLPPPRNAAPPIAGDARRMLAWKDQPKFWAPDGLLEHTSASSSLMFNANNATWRAIAAKFGIDANAAKEIVRARARGEPIPTSLVEASADRGLFGVAVFETSFPADSVIITLSPSGARWQLRFTANHTPGDKNAPWRIDSVVRLERQPLDNADKLPVLPEPSTVFDQSIRERYGYPF